MTTLQEPHFFKPLLPGFHSGVTIPLEFFSKHIQGSEKNKPWKLRSDASDQVWEVIREGRTLTKGWKEFATAHDLRIGDIVIFKHEGDLVFHVTPFGPSSCEIQYTNPHNTLVVDPLTATPNSCASESSSRFTLLGEVDEVETEPYSSLSFIRGEREIKLPAKYQDIEWKTVRGRGKCGRRGRGSYH
ncbi:hypothetical protein Bca4012_056139 [Brassica carinata]